MAEQLEEVPDVISGKLKNYNEYMSGINQELADIDKILNKEAYQTSRPNGIASRVFTDVFGVIGLYLMLFILSDFTRVIITGDSLFGITWIIWGPYYYITEAPLLTRIWESKKFLKDLSEVEGKGDFAWPDDNSCTEIGNTYLKNCNEQSLKGQHPIREKLGDGLDWLIRHTIGKHFGGILGNATCEDQTTTITADCAYDRVQELWDAYNGFCDIYPTLISHRAADINWPNTVSMSSGDMSHFNDYDRAAYQMYYEGYLKIYDIGSTVFTGHGTPENLNPNYDTETFYCFNANKLFGIGNFAAQNGFSYLNIPRPSWYPFFGWVDPYSSEYKDDQRYFQLNYRQNRFNV